MKNYINKQVDEQYLQTQISKYPINYLNEFHACDKKIGGISGLRI